MNTDIIVLYGCAMDNSVRCGVFTNTENAQEFKEKTIDASELFYFISCFEAKNINL